MPEQPTELSCTFLGHQSWLIASSSTNILIDPVLTRGYGYSENIQFDIFPKRTISIKDMPRIDGIALTNEHLDHFDIASIGQLSNLIPIYIPITLPAPVASSLQALGFTVFGVPSGGTVTVGNVDVSFIGVDLKSPKWEHRVHSVNLRTADDRGVFVQSDGAIDFAQVRALSLEPRILIATNNAQIDKPNVVGAFANLLRPEDSTEMNGLDLLRVVVDEPASELGSVEHVLLSGAGYTYPPFDAQLFEWNDPIELASHANSLAFAAKVVGLLPGQILHPDSSIADCNWVIRDAEDHDREATDGKVQQKPRLLNVDGWQGRSFDDAVAAVHQELASIVPVLLNSTFGKRLIEENEYLQNPTGSLRFAIHLRDTDANSVVLGLDLSRSEFSVTNLSLRDAIFTIPTGLDVYAVDLLDVFEGNIQIWELATAGSVQWYVGAREHSPISFLYEAYSEQVRPDLAQKLIQRRLASHAG